MSIADTLPPRARAKLARFAADVADAHALLGSLQASCKLAEARVMNATHNITTADPRDAAHYKRLLGQLAGAEAELQAVERKRAARQAALTAAERVLQPLMQWLDQFRLGPVGERPQASDVTIDANSLLRTGETYQQAVDRIRDAIFNCRAEIARIDQAPPPLDVAKAQITAQMQQMAAQGAPTIEFVKGYGSTRIVWPGDVNRYQEANLIAWKALAWLHQAELTDFLVAQAEAMIGDSGIVYAERGPRIAELQQQLADLELQEEALIEAAYENDNVVLIRRLDANPRAILMLAHTLPEEPQQAAE